MTSPPVSIFHVPLFRLLAINLALGTVIAMVLEGGLIAFNLFGLRDLIAADYSPVTAIGLLLFGLFITFGSTAMGTAIMALGRSGDDSNDCGRRVRVAAQQQVAEVRIPAR